MRAPSSFFDRKALPLLWAVLALGLTGPRALACGEYELLGIVRFDPERGYRIVVAGGSKSETIFSVAPAASLPMTPYPDTAVRARVHVSRPFNGTRATVERIEKIAARVPDPLRPALDSRYTLVKKKACAP